MSHPDEKSTQRALRGTIEAVQESWPLQLIVRAGKERVAVALTDKTTVVRASQPADASALQVAQRVLVAGIVSSLTPPAMVAWRIDILA